MTLMRLGLGLAAAAGLSLATLPATTTPADAAKRHWSGHHGKHWKGNHWRHGNRWHHRGPRYGYGWGPGVALGFGAPFIAAAPYAYYGPRCFWKQKRYGAKWVCR